MNREMDKEQPFERIKLLWKIKHLNFPDFGKEDFSLQCEITLWFPLLPYSSDSKALLAFANSASRWFIRSLARWGFPNSRKSATNVSLYELDVCNFLPRSLLAAKGGKLGLTGWMCIGGIAVFRNYIISTGIAKDRKEEIDRRTKLEREGEAQGFAYQQQ